MEGGGAPSGRLGHRALVPDVLERRNLAFTLFARPSMFICTCKDVRYQGLTDVARFYIAYSSHEVRLHGLYRASPTRSRCQAFQMNVSKIKSHWKLTCIDMLVVRRDRLNGRLFGRIRGISLGAAAASTDVWEAVLWSHSIINGSTTS